MGQETLVEKWVFTEIDRARFWVKAKAEASCWEWQGPKNACGYGVFRVGGAYGKNITASRVSYMLIYGPIPESLHVLHKCDNPSCVNPDHLFTGTHQDNMRDMARKGRNRRLGRVTPYAGVTLRSDGKRRTRWRAFISVNRKCIYLGDFATDIEAAKCRDEEVIKRGLLLPLNFPPTLQP